MKQIMLVSDKVVGFSNFITPLKNKYPVDAMGYINTARYTLAGRPKEYILIIIEIGMNTLDEFSLEETLAGYITGIIWYKKELVSLGIPVLFWSYEDQDYEIEIQELKKEFPDNKIGFSTRDNFEENCLLNDVDKFLLLGN